MLGDWFDPQGQSDQADLVEELRRQDSTADAFVTGRHTFEALRPYRPRQSEDATGMSEYLNTVHKYVVSSTMTDPQWQNSTVLSGDPVQENGTLKEQPGQDIVVTGEHQALPHPDHCGTGRRVPLVRLSRGPGPRRRLFPDGFEHPLTLLEARGFSRRRHLVPLCSQPCRQLIRIGLAETRGLSWPTAGSALQRHKLAGQRIALCFGQPTVGNRNVETTAQHSARRKDSGTVPGECRADARIVAHSYEPGLRGLSRLRRRDDDRRWPVESRAGGEVGGPGKPRCHAAMHLILAPSLGGVDLHVLARRESPKEAPVASSEAAVAARGS